MTSLPENAVSTDTRSSAGVLESLAGVSYYGSPRPSRASELDVATTPKTPVPLGKCLHCSAPVQSFLCWNCGKMLRRVLADVPWLLRRLAESAYGEAKVARKGGPRVSTGERLPSLPLNSRAADLIRDAARLVRWAEQVAGAGSEGPTTPDACEGAARYLTSEVGRMMQHPYAPDALRWSLGWREDATKAVDLPPDTTYAGPCQATVTELAPNPEGRSHVPVLTRTCGAALYVDAEALVADCHRCGAAWRVEDLQREALARVDDRPRTAADMWRLFKFLGREVPRSSFYQLMATVEAHDVSGDYPTYTYTAVARALDDRDAADAARKAAGKAKRGRPRKPKTVDAPTVTVDGSTETVLPSELPQQATG
ncbi:hypothetical protein I5G87_gp68 [Mycobacterium phage Ekdilam]|uniref:Uncharacterized protein n=1 Tax=Mycobacterium phage Ekdilam TaxID=2599862 RepID=A0A5J6TS02_9CAUD|nr:hypothetical protein I5G87_gp68 [Mycobacterium phage Ekdilam]QFG11492.1 hypothetical protein PBI_EKDILAM_68 [Mycobacterium phage Ekdilam]